MWPKPHEQNARPAARVWVQTFYLDTHEVTYEAYEACIEAGACTKRPEDGRWGPRYTDFGRPRQPITGVSWYHAVEYCAWRGQRLPTEAQWEKGARGPDGDRFPWGNAPATCARAVIKDPELGRSCGVKKRGSADTGRVVAVGTRPAGRYGLYDMIGNVEEWVYDWYTDDWDACGKDCLGIEPRGPCQGEEPCAGRTFRVVRGGSWYWGAEHGTAIHRRPHYPHNPPPKHYHHFGFRCGADVEQARALTAAPAR